MSEWKIIEGNIVTKWAKDIDPDKPLPEYPRPQLQRSKWLNLNGMWDYSITLRGDNEMGSSDGKILVPYCVESALSGVKKPLSPKEILWYRREFKIPEEWGKKSIILHFGAVDWETIIYVNGKEVGYHKGGYLPFSFNITKHLKEHSNELIVKVWDPSDKGMQQKGKQVLKPKGIFYTPISGIWQTVWLEPINSSSIESLKITPSVDESKVSIFTNLLDVKHGDQLILDIDGQSKEEISCSGEKFEIFDIRIENPKLWSPDEPNLYNFSLSLVRDGQILDEVKSYFALRKISIMSDTAGIPRMQLNNKQIFQYGPLDQGYWPDGLYTAPTDDALKYDIEIAKKLGFNMIRKHIKVEPARWYYYCDVLGMLVWQDMPSGGWWLSGAIAGVGFRSKLYIPIGRFKKSVQDDYHAELKEMIESLYNFPCIVMWVPFNEGWGQFKVEYAVNLIKSLDSTRFINNASGWIDKKLGDVHDIHAYPGPKMPKIEEKRAAVNGEFGGLGLVVEDHIWNMNRNWGYRKMSDPEQFKKRYSELMSKLELLIKNGLTAAVYTQITDVEGEVNGLLTYDREIVKIPEETLKELHDELYQI